MTEQTRKPWHEQDGFWQTFGPVIFDEQRKGLAAGEVEHIVALLGLEQPQRVCDLCCGVGRHSIELARRGFILTAVDRTEHYLAAARAQAEQAGVEIELVHEDMRTFCRPEAFDVVLNLFTSFGYFDARWDDRRAVENAHRSLQPGGQLLIDMIGKEIAARIFRQRDWRPVDGGFLLEERRIVDDWSRIENRWILLQNGRQHDGWFSHRLYSAEELRCLLLDCGFATVRVHGALDGRPYDEKAERLVVVARKQAPGLDAGRS